MSKSKGSKSYFSKNNQANARRDGEYENIASNVNKCVFCDLRKKYVVAEKSGVVLTVNLFPYNNGHLLVIPKRHIEDYRQVSDKEVIAYHNLAKDALKFLRSKLKVDGVWLLLRDGMNSGKTVRHLHWQVIPYFEGLIEWNYQEIDLLPIDLAKMFKK